MEQTDRKLALVTGAGSGIGRAIALRLVRAGFVCVLVGRRKEPLQETASLAEAEGGEAVVVPADVTEEDCRKEVLDAVDGLGHPLRGLVNNAGGSHASGLFDQDVRRWRDEFALNVEAAAFLSFEAIRRMAGTGGGSIVNVGSVYGIVALNNSYYEDVYPSKTPNGPIRAPAYSASKGALRLLSRELAVSAAPMGVRVNTVSPGMIRLAEDPAFAERDRLLAEATPMGRMGRPDEIAGAVNFLLSDEASFMTGAEMVIDGGWTTW
ncbi:short-chain dehydrogenase [Amycolatopsis deserti]|uniref:Short-chain dehydrogenase n=1 Tax=Amycolatopsis deserti TaxID=185696 RepID=A0ABQ3J1U8_9PSEU|nr:SDR family oxidoreductase [Amycolatopsis deserti]GHE98694.1 short-chain dehydrogenase [Amycolatopsis deserti]